MHTHACTRTHTRARTPPPPHTHTSWFAQFHTRVFYSTRLIFAWCDCITAWIACPQFGKLASSSLFDREISDNQPFYFDNSTPTLSKYTFFCKHKGVTFITDDKICPTFRCTRLLQRDLEDPSWPETVLVTPKLVCFFSASDDRSCEKLIVAVKHSFWSLFVPTLRQRGEYSFSNSLQQAPFENFVFIIFHPFVSTIKLFCNMRVRCKKSLTKLYQTIIGHNFY